MATMSLLRRKQPFSEIPVIFLGVTIPIMIMIAAVLSAVLSHWPDVGVILVLLILNAVVGFREEFQAGNVIAALKQKLAVPGQSKTGWHMVRHPRP